MEWISDTISIICMVYAALPLLFLLAIPFWLGSGRTIPGATWTTVIDFGKWYLASVSLVVSASLIKDGITERETGIKEMESFQKYTDIITEKGGIEKRWELCNYFAKVTPTPRLRHGWEAYLDFIKPSHDQFTALAKKEEDIKNSSLSGQAKLTLYARIGEERAALQAPLVMNSPSGNEDPEWVIILTTDTRLDQAQYELKKQQTFLKTVRLYSKDGLYFCLSAGYGSKAEAQAALALIANRFTTSPRVLNIKTLCGNAVFNGQYYECR